MFRTAHQEEDNLYEFNASMDRASKPMTSANRAPGTSMNRQAIGSSAGRAPGSRMGLTTGQVGGGGEARPMTSISGAGYQGGAKEHKAFDPLNQGSNRGPAPPLLQKSENSHEDKAKDMEKGVHRLIEASADAIAQNNLQVALDKAKEAGKAERALCKFRESHGLAEQINIDLTYAICLTLANAYYHNKMYDEALNTYQLIVKNKQYPHSGRLRVNIGNIYYDQKKYPQAIKMYRMALDQIPISAKELRFRILRNIGNAFVRLGQFQDAIDSYDLVMAGSADHHTAFNLLLCLYARGDKEKTRKHFSKMISIPIQGMTEEDEERLQKVEVLMTERVDFLKEELGKRYESANDKILAAARLIAPIIEENDDWVGGYKWVMETLRTDHEATASKLEIDLSMAYMQKRRFEDAIDVLKGFERKEPSLRAMAATNLSFIYFLEGDMQQAEKYADVAIKADRYNAKALVNKGNCFYCVGDYNRAKEMYLEAVGVEANCVEAIFNLGLANIKVNAIQEAHHAFDKLHTILPSAPEALFQLGSIYERSSDQADLEQAAKTFEMLLNKVPGDPNLCSRIGQVYERMDDENAACHWQSEAHRHFPVNLNVISWLGVWYVKREMYDQAIEYFERAAIVQPSEVKWRLMVASCHRRLGDFHRAYELYNKIHEEHPENIEALQYLEALCRDLGRPYEEFTKKLDKLRRSAPASMMTQAGGATRAEPQRSERPLPDRPQRSERPAPERPPRDAPARNIVDDQLSNNAGRSPLAAPRANPVGAIARVGAAANKARDDDDDFAGTDVSSLLG